MSDDREAPHLTDTAAVEEESSPSAPATSGRCPYLVGTGRAWVASAPSAEHRCDAVAPPSLLGLEKQRRLCLSTRHLSCATYVAAGEVRASRIPELERSAATWGWVRTEPVIDGTLGAGANALAFLTERRGWQVLPAIALVVALGALGLSNLGGRTGNPAPSADGSGAAVASPSATATPAGTPAAPSGSSPEPTPSAAPSARPIATPTVTPTPVATVAPSAQTTYKVKSGDTLYVIALKYGVTVKDILTLNGLTSNVLHVGQVLKIP